MQKTKVDATLAAAEEEHAGSDPERAGLIKTARFFKSSWLELAESLTKVRRSAAWKRWGFESFEQYTKLELHLRPETVGQSSRAPTAFSRSERPRSCHATGLPPPSRRTRRSTSCAAPKRPRTRPRTWSSS